MVGKQCKSDGLSRYYCGLKLASSFAPRVSRLSRGRILGNEKAPFEEAQIILGNKSKPAPRTHKFAFTGLMHCGECGASVTAEIKKGKYIYYHCTKRIKPCSQKGIEEKELKKQVAKRLGDIEITSEFHQWAMGVLRRENETETKAQQDSLNRQQSLYNQCVRSIGNLIDMRAADEISAEEFKKKKNDLTAEKGRLEALLRNTEQRADTWLVRAEEVFNFAQNARERFVEGSDEVRHQILANLGQRLILRDRELYVEFAQPLPVVLTAAKEARKVHKRLELQKSPMAQRDCEEIYNKNPILLRWLEGVRTAQKVSLRATL